MTVVVRIAFKIKNYLSPQEFPSVAKTDSGKYYCQASNEAGPTQSCKAMMMEVRKYALVLPYCIFYFLFFLLTENKINDNVIYSRW